MSEIVSVLGVTHNPLLTGRLARDPDGWRDLAEGMAGYRRRLAEAQADLVVVVGSDHLNQWFTHNMPPFLVGRSPRAVGPFPYERETFGLAAFRAETDTAFANDLIEVGFDTGVDLAYSDEYVLDHSFTVPMNFLRPEQDLPLIPIFCNVLAPPFPSARRFYEVGRALRRAITAIPGARRVAVVGSGHLSVEIGGPKMPDFSSQDERPDPAFDEHALDLMARGADTELIEFASRRRMFDAGNVTSGFLTFVLLAGLAGSVPDEAVVRNFQPFFAWR